MSNDTIGFFQSKTIWAQIVAVLALVGYGFGVTFGESETATLTEHLGLVIAGIANIAGMLSRKWATRRIR